MVFYSDTVFIVLVALFALSNGYQGSICMMFAPKVVQDPESQSAAASIMVSFLVLGLACGSILSAGMVKLL